MLTGLDAQLDQRMKEATIVFHFGSSMARSNPSLIYQCYGAAALADVAKGVLIDPQEAGPVQGAAVYDIARANSDWVLDSPPEPLGGTNNKPWWRRMLGL
jgi:hypothetical protein